MDLIDFHGNNRIERQPIYFLINICLFFLLKYENRKNIVYDLRFFFLKKISMFQESNEWCKLKCYQDMKNKHEDDGA